MTDQKYILTKFHELQKADLLTWARFLGDIENRRVAKDTIGNVEVSTVFLGLDHNFGEGKPLLFETMIFGGERDGEIERYSTWDEAVAGHKKVVDELCKEEPETI